MNSTISTPNSTAASDGATSYAQAGSENRTYAEWPERFGTYRNLDNNQPTERHHA